MRKTIYTVSLPPFNSSILPANQTQDGLNNNLHRASGSSNSPPSSNSSGSSCKNGCNHGRGMFSIFVFVFLAFTYCNSPRSRKKTNTTLASQASLDSLPEATSQIRGLKSGATAGSPASSSALSESRMLYKTSSTSTMPTRSLPALATWTGQPSTSSELARSKLPQIQSSYGLVLCRALYPGRRAIRLRAVAVRCFWRPA